MRKRILPLIALCLITTPVYAAGTIDAVIPVSCTAKNSNEEFKVSIKGDDGNQASPETVYIKDGETENISVSFSTPGTYKYIVAQEAGGDNNTTYDKTVYNADVYVTENDSGVMSAETIVYKNGSDNKLPECNFTNTVNITPTPAAEAGSDIGASEKSSDIGASEKSGNSSTTSGINTGVITHEAFYAMAGLFGITVMLITAKRRRKNK